MNQIDYDSSTKGSFHVCKMAPERMRRVNGRCCIPSRCLQMSCLLYATIIALVAVCNEI